MRTTLITGLLALSSLLLPAPAHARDCGTNTSGQNVCVHRVTSSTKNPAMKMVYYSINSGQMFVTAVDCSDYTAYNEANGTWIGFGPNSAFHRSCTNWR